MPSIIDEAVNIVRDAEATAQPIATGARKVENLITETIRSSASSVGAGLSAAEDNAAHAAASSLIELSKFGNAVAALNVLVSLIQVKHYLKDLFNKLPRIFGGPASALIDRLIVPEEGLLNYITDSIGNAAKNHVKDHVRAVSYGVQASGLLNELLSGTIYQKPVNLGGSGQVNQDKALINLQSEINDLRAQLHKLGYSLGISQHHEAVPRQVWDEIHQAQHQLYVQGQAINELQSRVERLTQYQASLETRLTGLQGQLGNMRAIQIGWTDIVTGINVMQHSIATLQANTDASLHAQGRQIAQLAPLGLLLQPGIQGLRTLRQLEDTPCMCAKPINYEGVLALAMATMEFVENG